MPEVLCGLPADPFGVNACIVQLPVTELAQVVAELHTIPPKAEAGGWPTRAVAVGQACYGVRSHLRIGSTGQREAGNPGLERHGDLNEIRLGAMKVKRATELRHCTEA